MRSTTASSSEAASPTIIVDPELLVKTPEERRRELLDAMRRDWGWYVAIGISVFATWQALGVLWPHS